MERLSACARSACVGKSIVQSVRSIGTISAGTMLPPCLPSSSFLEKSSSTTPPTSPDVRARHSHTSALPANHNYATLARTNRLQKSFPGSFRSFTDNANTRHDNQHDDSTMETLQDLKTFLTKVGTDSKEARYWLKHFQETSALGSSPFAVVFVPALVMRNAHSVSALAFTLAFLQRNNMRTVVVHGVRPRKLISELQESNRVTAGLADAGDINYAKSPWAKLRAAQQLLDSNSTYLIDSLSKNHGFAQLVPSTSVFYVDSTYQGSDNSPLNDSHLCSVDSNLIQWCLKSSCIPVVSAMAQSADGRIVHLEPFDAVASLVRALQPRKVILLNDAGALRNMTTGHKVSEVNCPGDNAALLHQPWCVGRLHEKLQRIIAMLKTLPDNGSVVLTSPRTILCELFTHHGDGTIFQKRDRVEVYENLEDVDLDRLKELLCRSFNTELDAQYFDKLRPKLRKMYLSENYNFAAIVTDEEGAEGIPYLDKFAIVSKSQGQGASQTLWDLLRRDFPTLFWRSYTANRFNEWYYPRCCGLQIVSKWKVFWYGFSDYQLSQKIVQVAGQLPESFIHKRPEFEEERDLTRPATWSSDVGLPTDSDDHGKKPPPQGNPDIVFRALEAI